MIKNSNSYAKVSSCGYNKKIIIEPKDTDNICAIYMIWEILMEFSNNSNIFILRSYEKEEANIINEVSHLYYARPKQVKIWFNGTYDLFEKLIDSKYCIFYICDKTLTFDDFCNLSEMGHPRKAFSQLFAVFAFASGEFPMLEFGQSKSVSFNKTLNKLIDKGFIVKKMFLL